MTNIIQESASSLGISKDKVELASFVKQEQTPKPLLP